MNRAHKSRNTKLYSPSPETFKIYVCSLLQIRGKILEHFMGYIYIYINVIIFKLEVSFTSKLLE
jgi:hypothetical protein